jgi:hypothetical protein
MYPTSQQANDARAKLLAWGAMSDEVNVVTPGSASTDEGIMAAIMAGYVLKADAKIYAQGIRRGLSLVSVQAPFGTGRLVTYMLDAFHPVSSGLVEKQADALLWDEATPVSSALRLPLLAQAATPLSAFFLLPTLVRSGRTTCSALGLPELADSTSSISAAMGIPRLSHAAAPLSSLLKIPLLV